MEAINQRFVYVPQKALIASLVIHLIIPLLLFALGALSSWNLTRHLMAPDVYQNFIQVDVVDLPDLTSQQKPDLSLPVTKDDVAKTTQEQALPEDKNALHEPKPDGDSKQRNAKEELALKREKERALKRMKEEAKREAALNALVGATTTKASRAKIKGNILSQGTAATGKLGNAKDQYRALVIAAIKEHFNLYAWQKKEKGLVAVVTIDLYSTGRVRSKQMDRPSRDGLFNSAVMQAIDESQPLPLPDDLSLLKGGITVEFRPEE